MTSAAETLPPPALTKQTVQPPQAGPTPGSTRPTAVLVGLLFLTATAAFITANALNVGVLNRPDFLTGAAADTAALATGALLVLGQFGVVGSAVLLFPLLKRHGEALALAHLGFRVTELAASLFYLAVPLLTIELGTGLRNGSIDPSASSSLGALLHAQYSVAILMIYLVTSAGGLCMTVLLYRSRLIPRPIAILGLIGYTTLLTGCVLDMFNLVDVTQGIGLVALAPGGVFELIPRSGCSPKASPSPARRSRHNTSTAQPLTQETDMAITDRMPALTIHSDLAGLRVRTEKGAPDLGE